MGRKFESDIQDFEGDHNINRSRTRTITAEEFRAIREQLKKNNPGLFGARAQHNAHAGSPESSAPAPEASAPAEPEAGARGPRG